MSDNSTLAEDFVRGYLHKDWDGITSKMTEDVRVRALLPNFVQEGRGRQLAVSLMSSWLEPSDEVVEIEAMETASLPESERVSVRYLGRSGDSDRLYRIEHHIFLRIDDGNVSRWDCVCSGWQPVRP